jgi:hypothetical protein
MIFRTLIIYDPRIKTIGTRQLDLIIHCQPDIPNWIRKAADYTRSIFGTTRRADSAYYLKHKENLEDFKKASMIELKAKAIKSNLNLYE